MRIFRFAVVGLVFFLMLGIFGFWSLTAQAALINFSFTGAGSGNLDTTVFTNAPFQVLISADTDNVQYYKPDVLIITNLNGTINISTIGIGSFVKQLYVFNNQINEGVGFGNFSDDDLISLHVVGVGLDTYNLKSSFGPIFDEDPSFSQFHNVALDIGNITFSSMSDATFTATVVPLPGAVWLFASGLFGLAGLRMKFGEM